AELTGEGVTKSKTWPESARALSNRLRRAASFLRKVGIEIGFSREGRGRTRTIRITVSPSYRVPEKAGTRPSASSAPSAPVEKPSIANGFGDELSPTVANDADGRADAGGVGSAPTVRANPSKSNGGTAADGTDANIARRSVPAEASWRTSI